MRSYCKNDSVNHVDLWGLSATDGKVRVCYETNDKSLTIHESVQNTNIEIEIFIGNITVENNTKIEVSVVSDNSWSGADSNVATSPTSFISTLEVTVSTENGIYEGSNHSHINETSNTVSIVFPSTNGSIIVDIDINITAINQNNKKDEYNYEVKMK